MLTTIAQTIRAASLVFWDFDGVIKDSVDVKTVAFEQLFLPHGPELAQRVRRHHECNGGVSRFEKIPLYLSWTDEPVTSAKVDEYCDRFSKAVLKAVIDSPWVVGVREYLLANSSHQSFILVTATPQEEIYQILSAINISHCFIEVHGAPTRKAQAIKSVLERRQISPYQALMIGDSEADFEAAQKNAVPFILRKTPLNVALQNHLTGPMFSDLGYE